MQKTGLNNGKIGVIRKNIVNALIGCRRSKKGEKL